MTTKGRPRGAVTIEPLRLERVPDGAFDLVGAVQSLDAHGLFETQPQTGPSRATPQQWSYIAVHAPVRLTYDGTTARLMTTGSSPSCLRDLGDDPFGALDAVCEMTDVGSHLPPGTPAFTHGLAGVLSYDLGRSIEDIGISAIDDRNQSWLDMIVATGVIAIDHTNDTAVYCTYHDPTSDWIPPPSHAAVQAALTIAHSVTTDGGSRQDRPTATSTMTRTDHADAVATVLGHIAAGDVFQVNLSHRLTTTWTGGDVALYEALRGQSPSPYLALYRCADGSSVVSISPETYLLVRGRTVQTRPIKGTRARGRDPQSDRRARAALQASVKDRAENVMVVDMERNDLGRVCVPGTVDVPQLLEVEGHPTVWQLVSTVTGRLRDDVTWGELVQGTFPCGSVTGAPKVRAMQIIEALEPVRRGWYCGAIGLLGPNHVSLSVAIRTAVLHEDRVDYAAGGGIVADSDVAAEWDETLAKAAAFLHGTSADLVGT